MRAAVPAREAKQNKQESGGLLDDPNPLPGIKPQTRGVQNSNCTRPTRALRLGIDARSEVRRRMGGKRA